MKLGDIGGVAYWGHFGGFVSGALLGILFRALLGEQATEPSDIVGEEGYFEKRPSDTTELEP